MWNEFFVDPEFVIVIDIHANEQEMLGAGVNLHFIALFIGICNFRNVFVRQ